MLRVKDIYWAAGFLEGEGAFTHANGHLLIAASQVQKEPLIRLKNLFGGSLKYWPKKNRRTSFGGGIWAWRVSAKTARGLAMTLYTIMSPKRRKAIRKGLGNWKRGLGFGHNRRNVKCKRRHDYTFYSNGRKRCLRCDVFRYARRKK